MRRCPLCSIVSGHEVTPFETLIAGARCDQQELLASRRALAVIDVAPVARAHCLVIPRRHRLSVASCSSAELTEITDLATTLSRYIERALETETVMFEHGQRTESDNPFGCTIAHAHLHVAEWATPEEGQPNVPDVTFRLSNGGIAGMRGILSGEHYLYISSGRIGEWVATPERTASQVLRRHFLDRSWAQDGAAWNWSDQILLSKALGTEGRVRENLEIFADLMRVGQEFANPSQPLSDSGDERGGLGACPPNS